MRASSRSEHALNQTIAIAVGGALGALLRFWTSVGVAQVFGREFPYGTLLVNVLGSLAMGFLYVFFLERSALEPEWRALVLVGFLGAFTTFSTFSIETLNLLEQGAVVRAAVYVLVSVIGCVAAVWLGVVAGRNL